ncbi:hypothetical protein [Halegenticoccus tardaugens]|uniref:hypothetical protein n=1 Tax=Halegenticoccus tardaugens TaxID=2071624 RepID=UPI0013E99029|nr:hypothetical protein [Halegenticoccus tardaugens]
MTEMQKIDASPTGAVTLTDGTTHDGVPVSVFAGWVKVKVHGRTVYYPRERVREVEV